MNRPTTQMTKDQMNKHRLLFIVTHCLFSKMKILYIIIIYHNVLIFHKSSVIIFYLYSIHAISTIIFSTTTCVRGACLYVLCIQFILYMMHHIHYTCICRA